MTKGVPGSCEAVSNSWSGIPLCPSRLVRVVTMAPQSGVEVFGMNGGNRAISAIEAHSQASRRNQPRLVYFSGKLGSPVLYNLRAAS